MCTDKKNARGRGRAREAPVMLVFEVWLWLRKGRSGCHSVVTIRSSLFWCFGGNFTPVTEGGCCQISTRLPTAPFLASFAHSQAHAWSPSCQAIVFILSSVARFPLQELLYLPLCCKLMGVCVVLCVCFSFFKCTFIFVSIPMCVCVFLIQYSGPVSLTVTTLSTTRVDQTIKTWLKCRLSPLIQRV